MSGSDNHRCPECGRPLEGGPDEPCAACLLRRGLEATGADESDGGDSDPGSVASTSVLPRQIGPYRIERLLGEGGMGRVYLAHQEQPVRRTVALKLIKPGIDSKETLARFETERRSLELMEHASIARVLDAGSTDDGRPWFVMEYVDGLPINRFCDRHQLTTEDRVRLLIRVCEAVQHAHVKGVIHRDLKPSNVLIASTDDGPLPKVIDFGIAKATGERLLEWSHFTEMGRLIGTPEYMSPEQADTSRHDVDTRTDVYALGVILYELLVGRTPHDVRAIREAGLEEMLRRIREQELPTPSSRISTLGDAATAVAVERSTDPGRLLREVRGELDWITMRALEKDRERRYGSTRELAEELARYLAHEPILARAPSAAYRMRKFMRRHRLGVGIGAAALLTLVLFAGTMTWQAGLIARERDRARVEAAASEQVAKLMVELFRSADPYGLAGGEPSARDVLESGVERVPRELTEQPELQARMLAEMGWSFDGLGVYERATQLLEQAVDLYRTHLEPNDERTLRAMHYLGWVHGRNGQYDEAERWHREVVAGFEATQGVDHRDTLRQRHELIEIWLDAGMNDRAIPELETLLADQVAALGDDDEVTLVTRLFLGVALGHNRRIEEAAPHIDAALAGLTTTASDLDERRAGQLMRLGWACLFLERYGDGEAVYGQVLKYRQRALGVDHPQTLRTRNMLVSILDLQQRHDEAADLMRTILDARIRVLGPDHPETLMSYSLLADKLTGAKRYDESAAQYRLAIAGYERIGEQGFWPIRARFGLGRALRLQGRIDQAMAEYERVQAYCDAELNDRHPICRSNLEDTAIVLESRREALKKSN